nr:DUF3784 domain-containing protein [Blautia sp. Marseille-P3201T]
MKLADLSTGPDWVVYVGFIIFAVLSIVLISGHGSWLISGYNTASKEEKAKYNEKKLCRTMGIGMSVIAILLLIMGVFENILPAFFVYIALGIILADVVIIIVLGNTIVSAKYCYATHESRLHQNDRCKRFALCLVLTVRFRSLAPWGKLFQLFI